MDHASEHKINSLLQAVEVCRSGVFDTIEQEVGTSPRWQYLRSRLLKLFGQRGLEGKVLAIMNEVDAYEEDFHT